MRNPSTISAFDFVSERVSATGRLVATYATQVLFVILAMGSATTSMAQSDGVCCDPASGNYNPIGCIGPGDFSGDPDCIPIDGGLSLLALAGGGLAVARLRKRREEEDGALNA